MAVAAAASSLSLVEKINLYRSKKRERLLKKTREGLLETLLAFDKYVNELNDTNNTTTTTTTTTNINDDDDSEEEDDHSTTDNNVESVSEFIHGPFFFRLCTNEEDEVENECDYNSEEGPPPPAIATITAGSCQRPTMMNDVNNDFVLREKTFEHDNWDEEVLPKVQDMIKSGFMYTGSYDGVYCFVCDVMLSGWNRNDDPFVRHVLRSPTCKFAFRALLKHRLIDNKLSFSRQQRPTTKSVGVQSSFVNTTPTPLLSAAEEVPSTVVPPSSSCRRIFHHKIRPIVNNDVGFGGGEVTLQSYEPPIYLRSDLKKLKTEAQEYLSMKTRLRSFLRCSASVIATLPNPAILANSGFYYVGPNNETRCFSCYRTFTQWSMYDSPWNVHVKLSPNCPFIINNDLLGGSSSNIWNTNYCDERESEKLKPPPPQIVEFQDFYKRVDSFFSWSRDLAAAGFFLTTDAISTIQCYACGGRLNNLYELFTDYATPREMHSFWFPYCILSQSQTVDNGRATAASSSTC